MSSVIRKLWLCVKECRTPWHLQVAGAIGRGFLRDPRKTLRLARGLRPTRISMFRYTLQIHGYDFLAEFMLEASRLGMRPFLFWGSLLGLVREDAFMGHDYDIDTAILATDYARKDALVRAMLARGYLMRRDVPYAFSFETRDGFLHLDVDVVFPYRGKMLTAAYLEDEASIHEFPHDAFEPLERRRFCGRIDVWVPARPEEILACVYGRWREPAPRYDSRTEPLNRVDGASVPRGAGPSLVTE